MSASADIPFVINRLQWEEISFLRERAVGSFDPEPARLRCITCGDEGSGYFLVAVVRYGPARGGSRPLNYGGSFEARVDHGDYRSRWSIPCTVIVRQEL
jgi:hypothetical protein